MGHDKNDELRAEHEHEQRHRQELRDEAFDREGGAVADEGSQDERRHEGLGKA